MTKRAKQYREAPEMGAMLRRMVKAMGRRAGEGDLECLVELRQLKADIDQAIAAGARAAHDGPAAFSWTDIGDAVGITRQAARQLYGGPGPAAPIVEGLLREAARRRQQYGGGK